MSGGETERDIFKGIEAQIEAQGQILSGLATLRELSQELQQASSNTIEIRNRELAKLETKCPSLEEQVAALGKKVREENEIFAKLSDLPHNLDAEENINKEDQEKAFYNICEQFDSIHGELQTTDKDSDIAKDLIAEQILILKQLEQACPALPGPINEVRQTLLNNATHHTSDENLLSQLRDDADTTATSEIYGVTTETVNDRISEEILGFQKENTKSSKDKLFKIIGKLNVWLAKNEKVDKGLIAARMCLAKVEANNKYFSKLIDSLIIEKHEIKETDISSLTDEAKKYLQYAKELMPKIHNDGRKFEEKLKGIGIVRINLSDIPVLKGLISAREASLKMLETKCPHFQDQYAKLAKTIREENMAYGNILYALFGIKQFVDAPPQGSINSDENDINSIDILGKLNFFEVEHNVLGKQNHALNQVLTDLKDWLKHKEGNPISKNELMNKLNDVKSNTQKISTGSPLVAAFMLWIDNLINILSNDTRKNFKNALLVSSYTDVVDNTLDILNKPLKKGPHR